MLSLQTCVRAATLQNHSLILKTFFRKVRGLMSEGNILKGHAVKQTAEKMEKKTFRFTRTWPLGRHSWQAPVIRIHRQECPEITYMAMGFRPHSFPVGGMYMKGTGRLTKV